MTITCIFQLHIPWVRDKDGLNLMGLGEQRVEQQRESEPSTRRRTGSAVPDLPSAFRFFSFNLFSLKIPNNPQGIQKMGKFSTGSAGSPFTLGPSQCN